MIGIAFRCLMTYINIMWTFLLSDALTGFSIPWLTKTAHILAGIGVVILFVCVIVIFGIITYVVIANDPSFVEAMK